MSIRVVLADDHVLVRQGLRALLQSEGFAVVAEAADGKAAVREVQRLEPNIAVLDISMPLFNGLDAALEIRRTNPGTRTIILTGHDEPQYVAEALRCGVRGYVLKNQAAEDLAEAIRTVDAGRSYLSPGVALAVTEAYSHEPAFRALSVRERQVLQLITDGRSTREIAALMKVSVKTVETHRARLMNKLDVHDVAGLVRYAIRTGLIQP